MELTTQFIVISNFSYPTSIGLYEIHASWKKYIHIGLVRFNHSDVPKAKMFSRSLESPRIIG